MSQAERKYAIQDAVVGYQDQITRTVNETKLRMQLKGESPLEIALQTQKLEQQSLAAGLNTVNNYLTTQ